MLLRVINLGILSAVCFIMLFSLALYAIFSSPPQSARAQVIRIAPSVEVITANALDHPVTITAQGLVIAPNKAISLTPQVSGLIIKTHQQFILGGLIPAGDSIIQIEQTDFKIGLNEAEAKLSLAIASLSMEQGQQRLAKKEFELNDRKFVDDGENKALALRAPQLKQAKAQVQLAKNAVTKAEISLQRTNLVLPYDARVLSITATVGEFINQQQAIAVLTKANERWLALKFPAKFIDRLTIRTPEKEGSLVSFHSNNQAYQGEVISLLADLVSATKLSGAIVNVKKLKQTTGEDFKSSLLIGTHISATITAGVINNGYAIPREALINNNHVYVVDKNQHLQSRVTTLKWESKHKAIVAINLEEHDKIITGQVFGLITGTKVKAIEQVNL